MLDEAELVRLCVDGNEKAFEKLYLGYVGLVTTICRRFRIGADTEDLVQTVFLKVYRALSTYDGSRGSLTTWIATITRNACLNYVKSRRVRFEVVDTALVVRSAGGVLEDKGLCGDMEEWVSVALKRLPPQRQAILVLSDRDYQDIAKRLGVPIGTVKSRLNRARCALRKEYERIVKRKRLD